MSRLNRLLTSIQVPLSLITLIWSCGLLASLGPSSLGRYATVSAVNLVFAVGVYSYMGISGIVSFGHFAFAMVGAYVAGLLTMDPDVKHSSMPDLPGRLADVQLEPALAVVIAGLAAALAALLIAPAIARIAGLAASLATLSLLLVARSVAREAAELTRGPAGLSGVPRWTTLWGALVVASIVIVAVYAYQRSAHGLCLRSSRADVVAARAVGVAVGAERSIAWVFSAFIVGCGGALFVMVLGSVGPETLFIDQTFLVIAMVVVGGMSSLSGAVIGSVGVSALVDVLARAESSGRLAGVLPVPARPGLSQVALAVILIATLAARPSGLLNGEELRPIPNRAPLPDCDRVANRGPGATEHSRRRSITSRFMIGRPHA